MTAMADYVTWFSSILFAFGFGELKKKTKKNNTNKTMLHIQKTPENILSGTLDLGACYLETDKPTFPNFILCKGSLC
jgi:hypothetical protein